VDKETVSERKLLQYWRYKTLAVIMRHKNHLYFIFYCKILHVLKGEQGLIQCYFRKIPLHQQKLLVVSVLCNLPWSPKNVQNETT